MKLPLPLFTLPLLTLMFLLQVMPAPAIAAAPADPERIQQEQQLLIEMERRKQELENALKRPQETGPATSPGQQVPDGGGCVEVHTIAISGGGTIAQKRIDAAFAPYKGQCLTLAKINAFLQDITNIYIEAGYVTSRAFMAMPQKRLKDGVLEVVIIEGKISGFEGITKRDYWTAFPFTEGNILNLRDIEQGLEQINRLPSNNATMEIKPDETQNGFSHIAVSNSPAGRTRITAFTDNAGSESTGEWRAGLRLGQDNLLGLNDQINLSYTFAPRPNYDHKRSNSFTAGFNVPFGYWTGSYNFSYSDYRTSFLLPVSAERYYSYGDSINHNFSLERLLVRSQQSKISAQLTLTHKNSRNYSKVADIVTYNEASSRKLATLSFELPATLYGKYNVLYLKPGIVQGLRTLGALHDNKESYSQRAQFTAFKFYVYNSFKLGFASVTNSIDYQLSHHELFSSEGFHIGGQYSVRGFKDSSEQGDTGVTLRNDIGINLNQLFGTQNKALAAFKPGIFFDYGKVESNNENINNAHLAGTGIKCDFNYWIFDAQATYAWVTKKPAWIEENKAMYLYAGINLRF